MPKAWEQEETFHDTLYEWMERAPWIGISLGMHFVAYFMLLAIPWHMFQKKPETYLTPTYIPDAAQVEPPEPPVPIEKIEKPSDVEPEIDVVVQSDSNDTAEPVEDPAGEPDHISNDPFEEDFDQGIIGTGGGAGGMKGTKGKKRGGPSDGGTKIDIVVQNGLDWLLRHQTEEGYWDVDEYAFNNKEGGTSCTDGAGIASQDIGITGLALLAFLGNGHTTVAPRTSSERDRDYHEAVKRGVAWLTAQQDGDTGLIGEAIGHGYVYDHAIASLALAENFYFSRNPFQKRSAQKAMNFIARARAPYGGWRYEVPSDGDTDTSITGWMIFALKAGEEAGLRVDKEGYASAVQWLDSVTDPANGRVGYIGPERGGRSSRTESNTEFDPSLTEAMTGVGLLTRVFLGQTKQDEPMLEMHGDLMLRTLPEWDDSGHRVDMYYWYYATYAMFQLGGEHWRKWRKSMERAIIPHQRKDGDYKGSWDPIGPWGYQGGRVYATATMVLTLEVYNRYTNLLGGR